MRKIDNEDEVSGTSAGSNAPAAVSTTASPGSAKTLIGVLLVVMLALVIVFLN